MIIPLFFIGLKVRYSLQEYQKNRLSSISAFEGITPCFLQIEMPLVELFLLYDMIITGIYIQIHIMVLIIFLGVYYE